VFSHPIFFVFGACITVPKILLQFLLVDSKYAKNILESLPSETPVSFSHDTLPLLLAALAALIAGSAGIVTLISFANQREKNEVISFPATKKDIPNKSVRVLRLEVLLIALTLVAGSILALPADVALAQGLGNLAQTLSLSALGLTLSIALLLFFLRQYAILYLSLSKISLRAALENANHLFRTHIKETFFISAALFFVEITLIAILSFIEELLNTISFLSKSEPLFGWALAIIAFSLFEAWNWASWTSFFRMIALPKDPEPVLQKSETVIQQESAISLDKAWRDD